MKNINIFRIVNWIFPIFLLFGLTSCGYKASNSYAKKEIGEFVYIELRVNINDPKNSVLIKDVFNEMLVQILNKKLVYKKEDADTIVYLDYRDVKLSELSYDSSGYVKLYGTTVDLNVKYSNKNTSFKSFSVQGRYDFSTDSEGSISEVRKYDAIRKAFAKALEEVISKLAISGYR